MRQHKKVCNCFWRRQNGNPFYHKWSAVYKKRLADSSYMGKGRKFCSFCGDGNSPFRNFFRKWRRGEHREQSFLGERRCFFYYLFPQVISPPFHFLFIKTIQNMDLFIFTGDCTTWNATIAIWDTKMPDQIGTLIDRFCPEISAKEYTLNTTSRKIVIR